MSLHCIVWCCRVLYCWLRRAGCISQDTYLLYDNDCLYSGLICYLWPGSRLNHPHPLWPRRPASRKTIKAKISQISNSVTLDEALSIDLLSLNQELIPSSPDLGGQHRQKQSVQLTPDTAQCVCVHHLGEWEKSNLCIQPPLYCRSWQVEFEGKSTAVTIQQHWKIVTQQSSYVK